MHDITSRAFLQKLAKNRLFAIMRSVLFIFRRPE